jgi:coenzyme Q-binding protein COQ10
VKRQREARRLPYSAEQMFDLAADVERYPEFLPHWTQAEILHRGTHTLDVRQELDLGIRRIRFDSRATLERPRHLHIDSRAALFRHLTIDWRFTPADGNGCIATLTVELEMRSLFMDAVARRLMQSLTRDIHSRFRERAARLYRG